MSIYVYAILLSPENKIDLPQGIEKKVELIVYKNIAAIVERDVSIQNLQDTEDILLKAVVTHDRVIQNIFAQFSLLPLRFGSGFASVSNLLDHLKNERQQYLEKLDRLANKVEYVVKFTPLSFQPDETKKTNLKGKNYLLAKKKNYQLQQKFILEQENQWQEIKANTSQKLFNNTIIKDREEIKQIFLLEEQDTNIDNLINTWQQKASNWQITTDKPLPCYHFAAWFKSRLHNKKGLTA